ETVVTADDFPVDLDFLTLVVDEVSRQFANVIVVAGGTLDGETFAGEFLQVLGGHRHGNGGRFLIVEHLQIQQLLGGLATVVGGPYPNLHAVVGGVMGNPQAGGEILVRRDDFRGVRRIVAF